MEGYLYQILGDNVEYLYWSEQEIDLDKLKIEYLLYEKNTNCEEDLEFEEYYNALYTNKIERVFVDNIYI